MRRPRRHRSCPYEGAGSQMVSLLPAPDAGEHKALICMHILVCAFHESAGHRRASEAPEELH